MRNNDPINILLVDDQPGKLMSLEAIIEGLGENILKAGSADEALRLLLTHDIAVVVVDVCMPGMDGFELAELIRGHPRCRRSAIIFVSAIHLSEADRLKGYDLGAVDYIPVPIVPEMLKAKVAVFADLYRKTEQLHRMNRELEARVSARTAELVRSTHWLRESEQRYRQLLEGLPAAVYTCDADGRVTFFNAAAAELWGREPELNKEYWCGSWKIYRPNGTELPLDDCPMARTLRDRAPVRGEEILIERPDLTRRHVVPYPEPIFGPEGELLGARNMLMDVTERRAADALRGHLAAIVDSSEDAIVSKGLDGTIKTWNAAAKRMFGYSAEEIVGQSVTKLIPLERRAEATEILASISRGQAVEHRETVRVTKDGKLIDVSLTVSPLRDSSGRVVGAAKIVRDITERKKAEAVLARDRATLEQLVADRTAELQQSNDRLRIAERMVTIGTLSAGLGHDMANLLLPVRMRLDVIESAPIPSVIREDVEAIRKACEYLQRLACSLRLLALDPDNEISDDTSTDLEQWWCEVEGMVRNGVPRATKLVAELPIGAPHVRVGRAALTQIVFNLVQNAGDALKGRTDGCVRIGASAHGNSVRLVVSDNGPGMSRETMHRCLEPFYTTKTRGLSTGLGLALVSGIVKRAGGTINIQSETGRGATFTLDLPVAPPCNGVDNATPRRGNVAVVTLKDQRLQAHVQSVLASLEFEVRTGAGPDGADVWITETNGSGLEAARRFASGKSGRRAVVIGGERGLDKDKGGVLCIEGSLKPSALRARLMTVLAEKRPSRQHEQ